MVEYSKVLQNFSNTFKMYNTSRNRCWESERENTSCVQNEQETGRQGKGRGWVLGVSGVDILRDAEA